MLRKLICLILIGLLCLPACAEQEAPSHLYHFTSAAEAPAEIADSIADLLGSDVTYIDGYATMRFGRWTYGQIILQDAQGYILCGLTGINDGSAWKIEYSRTALREGALPQLLPDAVEYGYDDYHVSQYDGCDSFKIVYDDLTYRWFSGSEGWQLDSITDLKNDLKLSVTKQAITRSFANSDQRYIDQEKSVFNFLSPMLSDFDISAFPTTWEEAKALSDASEYGDQTQAVTVYDPWDAEKFNHAVGVPYIKIYSSPSRDSKCIAQVFADVQVEILDHNNYSGNNLVNDWYLISIHDFTGWIERDNLLIGSERAAAWNWLGEYALVYGASAQTEQPIYSRSNRSSPSAHLPVNTRVYVQLITDDGWFLVRDEQEALCWMEPDTVCQTDNLHDGYIYSEDPARRLNLRSGPGTQYESIGKYYSGTRVVFAYKTVAQTGWSRVIIEGVAGWVDSSFLKTYVDYYGKEWLPPLGKVQGVNSKGLNLRTAPNKNADIIAAYPVGTSVEILGIYDSIWAHVRLQDGNSGYMMLQFLGGEPEKAASNSFKLTRNITTTDGYGEALCEIKKGTYIRVTERPIDGQKNQPWISIEEGYGYIPPDCANFW